jgi:phosphoglycolate phosphatase
MAITLIIFDLDGTLIDSSADITDAINYAVAPYGIQRVTVSTAIGLIGEGVTRLIEKLIDQSRPLARRKHFTPEEVLGRFLDYYSSHLAVLTTTYPGGRETLEGLREYRKVVISNKREDLSVLVLRELDLDRYIDLVVGSDTTPARKPSPVPLVYAMEKFGAAQNETLIVGDSNFDIEAGKAAGIWTVGATYGYRPVDFLKDADFIIENMGELVGVVARLSSAVRQP